MASFYSEERELVRRRSPHDKWYSSRLNIAKCVKSLTVEKISMGFAFLKRNFVAYHLCQREKLVIYLWVSRAPQLIRNVLCLRGYHSRFNWSFICSVFISASENSSAKRRFVGVMEALWVISTRNLIDDIVEKMNSNAT